MTTQTKLKRSNAFIDAEADGEEFVPKSNNNNKKRSVADESGEDDFFHSESKYPAVKKKKLADVFWHPECFCGKPALQNDVTKKRDYIFFSCPARVYDPDTKSSIGGCKFWQRLDELDKKKECKCGLPMKRWYNQAKKMGYESCVYAFARSEHEVAKCDMFRTYGPGMKK